MLKLFLFLTVPVTAFLLNSCSKEDTSPSAPSGKTYSVTYTLSGTVGEIEKIRYLSADGDTLQVNNQVPVWSYTWTKKGSTGQRTFLEAVLLGQTGKLYFEIKADENIIVKDSISGVPSGQIVYSRGITLP